MKDIEAKPLSHSKTAGLAEQPAVRKSIAAERVKLVGEYAQPVPAERSEDRHLAAFRQFASRDSSSATHYAVQLQRQYGNRYVQRLVAAAAIGNGERQIAPAVESAIERKRGGGKELDYRVRGPMELALGSDFSGVRVHTDNEAGTLNRAMDAVAFTTGRDIFFSPEAYRPESSTGRELLAHELSHVVQQSGNSGHGKLILGGPDDQYAQEVEAVATQVENLPQSRSGEHIARQPATEQRSQGVVARKPEVLESRTVDHPRATRVTIVITGHASPRWRGARSNADADKLNMNLSHQREKAVREQVEYLISRALPDQHLIFDYATSQSVEDESSEDSATVDIASSAVGSKETLQEAGKAGRHANEPAMLRVNVGVSLSSVTDIDQDNKIQETHHLSTKTQDWAINMGVGAQVDVEVGGGFFNFMLKNGKTGREVEGWAEFSVAAPIAAGLPVPTISRSGYTDFRTREPADFSDFDYKRFFISTDFGINLLLVGGELSYMTILGLPGGPVSDIDVGGFAMGGAGVTIESKKFGMMALREIPDDTYPVKIVRDEHKSYTSHLTEEEKQHRVLFGTGKADISPDQEKALEEFIVRSVANYQRAESQSQP